MTLFFFKRSFVLWLVFTIISRLGEMERYLQELDNPSLLRYFRVRHLFAFRHIAQVMVKAQAELKEVNQRIVEDEERFVRHDVAVPR